MSAIFDPGAIEKKIDSLLSRTGRAGQRTSLLTLIAVCHRNDATAFTALIDTLFGRRPLRIIRIENGYEGDTQVDVSARCLPSHGGEEICFQEIVIYNGMDKQGLMPSLWSPLVIRDLPVILFWRESLSSLFTLVRDSELTIDKCILDTTDCPDIGINPIDCYARLSQVFLEPGHGEEHIPLADLTWKRLAFERYHTAALFDPPAALPALQATALLTFRGFPQAEALLLLFWISARLGLSFLSREGAVYHFRNQKGSTVSASIEVRKTDDRSLTFSTRDGIVHSVAFLSQDQVRFITPQRRWEERRKRPSLDHFLIEEIDTISHDPLYDDTMRALSVAGKKMHADT
ncbi:MAG TPA: hypothetical protein ENN69_02110 [Spirochaetia bacterium]|nr:hypothetical protein [Spirochaetia bacterium]